MKIALALLACMTPALSGCLYTHTITPLSTNFHDTPVVADFERGDVKQFDYYIRVAWNANGIGEIAKKHGFDEVYYADLETLQILGIWKQRWAHVYGSR